MLCFLNQQQAEVKFLPENKRKGDTNYDE